MYCYKYSIFILFLLLWISDNTLSYLNLVIYLLHSNTQNSGKLFKSFLLDNSIDTTTTILSSNLVENLNKILSLYSLSVNSTLYENLFLQNQIYLNNTYVSYLSTTSYPSYVFTFFTKFFTIYFILFIIYSIFFLTNIQNALQQNKVVVSLTKLFILNATEKEIGPVDDYFFFAILVFLTITLFVFSSIIFILTQSTILLWGLTGFFLLMVLILTIPVNLFIDFGINFCVGVRGSGTSNNLVKELMLDVLSSSIVFIRFVVQNIRFLFIFFGIIELLEWVLGAANSFIVVDFASSSNLFLNFNLISKFYATGNFNFLIINTILFIILYLYYFLHLLFLLLVQVTIYIGVSIWLFFFLYSSRYTTKLDKFFVVKK